MADPSPALSHAWMDPIAFGSSWFPVCTCGYVGVGCLTRAEALRTRCDVAESLDRSADLLHHIRASSEERRSVIARHE